MTAYDWLAWRLTKRHEDRAAARTRPTEGNPPVATKDG